MTVHEDWSHVKDQSLLMWAEDIDAWATSKGWNEDYEEHGEPAHIALMHSELSEALEAFREGVPEHELVEGTPLLWHGPDEKPQGMATEMADVVIRILHWCARHDVDLGEVMAMKMAYNEGREYRHGGKAL